MKSSAIQGPFVVLASVLLVIEYQEELNGGTVRSDGVRQ